MYAHRVGTLMGVLLCGAGFGCDAGQGPTFISPPVPDGFPELEHMEEGQRVAADIIRDGNRQSESSSGGVHYRGFEHDLKAARSISYFVQLHFAAIEPGIYDVEAGTLEFPGEHDSATGACGSGRLEIFGPETYDSDARGEQDFMWGTFEAVLCDNDDLTEVGELDGHFTALVDYD